MTPSDNPENVPGIRKRRKQKQKKTHTDEKKEDNIMSYKYNSRVQQE